MEPIESGPGAYARLEKCTSLVELVRYHAAQRPDQPALIFLPDGETEVGNLSYGELDRRARAFAARLQAEGLAGRAVLLMLPSSIYYVVAFLGSLYAGAVPVPVYPPTSSMHAERIAQIVKDCDAKGVILTTSSRHDSIQSKLSQFFPQGLGCAFLSIDQSPAAQESDWIEPAFGSDTLAYLQYTSGSTSDPRGVMVTHGNLLAYCRSMQAAARQDHTDVYVSWLPLFHDMGLIGCVIQPLFLGATIVLMPPMAFLQKPLRWLAAISRYRGTASFAPNFAYELCAATLDETLRATLDLSCWSMAANAAEPVHAETLSRFAQRFASCGFRPEAMNPCYGLAEATLSVTQQGRLEAAHICEVDAEALKSDRFIPVLDGEHQTRALVSCGRTWSDVKISIVKPDSCRLCEPGEIGEIWVSGPVVAAGYWRRPAETAHTFQGFLDNGDGPFLRTGDLGALYRDELYVTGRIKDVIIVRGQNHYPQDIELSVCRSHPALEIGHGAAFSVEFENQEKLVVVQEIRRSQRKKFDGVEIVQAIRAVVAEQHGLMLHAVMLLSPASVHITSSGKIQRKACKRDYLEGRFEALYTWCKGGDAAHGAAAAESVPIDAGGRRQAIATWLANNIARRKKLHPAQVAHGGAFRSFGLDSMEVVALSGELSTWLEQAVDPTLMYDYPTIEHLAQHLAGIAPGRANDAPASAGIDANEAIAIVGMACRLPGADSVEAYWRLLECGHDAITEVPASRWPLAQYYQAGAASAGKMNTRWGGFIEGVDHFDARFFGISPREAQSMDPQQRLLLETAWHALEDAGMPPDALAGSKTGVFVGISANDYRELQFAHHAGTDAYSGTGNALSIAANRLSYFLDLRGPSLAIDTACSSSLVAVHQARLALRARDCHVAIVGGVNLILAPGNTLIFSQAQMMAADGRCKTFDAGADGYVRAEGCGVLVLKRHADAVRDKDRILALIPGSAVNQDGRSNGLSAPNGIAQQAVIRDALAAAGKTPQQVSYVEAHGTGTSLGDPIEVKALKEVYGARSESSSPLWIGAVKANIGHLEAAAGIAGLIKTVLMLQHRRIPPQLHVKQLNPLIVLDDSRLAIPAGLQEWDADEGEPRLAGVSSFGFGGTNAHVIVQQAPAHAGEPAGDDALQLLSLSARNQEALCEVAAHHAALIGAGRGFSLAEICHAASTQRSHHAYRLALPVRTLADAADQLRRFAQGGKAAQIRTGFAGHAQPGKTAFLFTGQGSQYADMGRVLYQTHAGFRQTLAQCDAIVLRLEGWSLLSALYESDASGADLHQTRYTQPALFALEYALAQVWQSAGVQPDFMIGHSLGEYVAACIAGVFSLEDGLTLVSHRGRLMQDKTPPGAMYAVRGPAELITQVLEAAPRRAFPQLAIAAHNSPTELVLSGAPEAVDEMVSHLVENGAVAVRLQVTRAFHSPLVRGMQEEFERCAQALDYQAPRIPLVSNVTGQLAGPEIASAGYWVRHVLAPVQFAHGLQTLAACGCSRFVEIGPQPVLTGFGQKTMPDALWLHSLRRDTEDDSELAGELAQWYVNGGMLDWNNLREARRGSGSAPPQPIGLPLYPFRKDSYWFEAAGKPAPATITGQECGNPLLGQRIDVALDGLRCFAATLPGAAQFLRDHQVRGRCIMPGAGYVSLMLHAARQACLAPADMPLQLRSVCFIRPLDLTDGDTRTQTVLQQEGASWRVQVSAWNDAAACWQPHASAAFAAVDAAAAPPAMESEGRCEPQDIARFYEYCSERGLEYGERFRAIRVLKRGADVVCATVALADDVDDLAPDALHPALLDAAFQTVAGLLRARCDALDCMPIPARIESFILHDRPAREMRVEARLREVSDSEALADIVLRGVAGHVIAEVRGLAFAWVSAQSGFGGAVREDDAPMFYLPSWVEAEAHEAPEASRPAAVLLVYPPGAENLALAIARSHQGARQLAIRLAEATAQRGAEAWDIDMTDAGAYLSVLPQLGAFDAVYFLGGLQVCEPAFDEAALRDSQEYGILSLFRLCKALTQIGHRSLIVKAITAGAQSVFADEAVLPLAAGIGGFLKSAAREYPDWAFSHIDIGAQEAEGVATLQATAAAIAVETQSEIALRAGRRFKRILQEMTPAPAAQSPFREQGVYLILGGAGGIGFELARHLAQHHKAKLSLLGRTPLNAALRQKIAEIEALGGEVLYLQADATKASDLRDAVRETKARFGSLNGAVHSALVLHDKILDNMDESSLRAVLAPKVQGSAALYQAVAQEPLDFLLLFSSVQSFLGSAGQASYAAANAGQDALAHAFGRQASFPVKLINWGYWGDVGVVANNSYRVRLAQQGIGSISTAEGMAAIQSALCAPASQLVCIKAEQRVCAAMGVDPAAVRLVCAATAPSVLPALHKGLNALGNADAEQANRLQRALRAEAQFSLKSLLKSLQDKKLFLRAYQSYTVDQLRRELHIAPRYFGWFDALIEHLAEAGWISQDEDGIRTMPAVEQQAMLAQAQHGLLAAFPELQARIALLMACNARLWDMVTEKVAATEILFPHGSAALVESVYHGNPLADRHNRLATASVAAYVAQRLATAAPDETIRILEVGASTGGASAAVLAALMPFGTRVAYVYSDLSPAFLRHGEARFAAHPAIAFRTLDIERDPIAQGFALGQFDMVLAANVLHATRDIGRTLGHVKRLLKQNGVLLLNEVTHPSPLYTLSFGLLAGWWLFEDAHCRIEHSPLLTADGWKRQLARQGFTDFMAIGPEPQVLLAQSGGIVPEGSAASPEATPIRRESSAHPAPAGFTLIDAAALLALPAEQASRAILHGLAKLAGEIFRIDFQREYGELRGELRGEELRGDALRADGQRLADVRLSALGIDSLMAMELRNRVRAWIAVDVPAHTLIDGTPLAEVAQLLHQKLLVRHMNLSTGQPDDETEMEVLVL